MTHKGVPFIPVGTSKSASERWHKLLAKLPPELLLRTDIHELRLLYQLLALSDALSKKTEADPSDSKSCRMLDQVEVILKRIRDGSSGLEPSVARKVMDGNDDLKR